MSVNRREVAVLIAALVVASVLLHLLHWAIFHDLPQVMFYMLGDLAFLPLQVLIVTLVIDRVLAQREAAQRQHKMNMVIGTFFSAVGQPMMGYMRRFVRDCPDLYARLAVAPHWREQELREARRALGQAQLHVVAEPQDLMVVRELLHAQRGFLLGLLENPMLLEHEAFTDALWAIFHLAEELDARQSLDGLPPSDLRHLASDTARAYSRLLHQWLGYMMHLQRHYPYLYSLAARTNPLRPDARPEVLEG